MKKMLASDNSSGVHMKIMEAIINVNTGHALSYGEDEYTEKAIQKFKDIFGKEIEVYFVYNGTAANVLGLSAMAASYNGIICPVTAHINGDECGAAENYGGFKLLTVPGQNGKISINEIKTYLQSIGFQHHSQPKVVSITQATELGDIYTVEEIKEIADFIHQNEMYLHMDGARISNAAVALDVKFKEMTKDAGVDILSFGGTKNGLMFGEAVVVFNKHLSKDFKYIRKQGMQLHSKMRYIAAQFEAYLTDDLWYQNAKHANDMARLLAQKVAKIPEVRLTHNVKTNEVFAVLPASIIPQLQEKCYFYIWNEESNEVRWVTSFDTTEQEILEFIETLQQLIVRSK